MKTTDGRRRRSYVARYCACGAQAIYAVQVMARTLGPGQSKDDRKIKLGRTAIVCGECSRNVNAFLDQVGHSSLEALDQVRQPRKIHGTPLFDQAEA